MFIDECHDALTGHPDRADKWNALASRFSRRKIPIVLMSATVPPHLTHRFATAFHIKQEELMEIRSSTNRPEIGMHVVRIKPGLPSHVNGSLERLVHMLSQRLAEHERMLVFFPSQHEAQAYAERTRCAVYHSQLFEEGNTRTDNLRRWDEGQTKIMACTTAFAQGIDRPNIRSVVIFKPTFGLLTVNQMLGRAGRDGQKSHVFFLTVGDTITTTKSTNLNEAKDRCLKELELLINGNRCRRSINSLHMDGDILGTRCDETHGEPCDVCDPHSPMQQLAMKAVQPEAPSGAALPHSDVPKQAHPPQPAPCYIPEHAYPAFVPASSVINSTHQTMTNRHVPKLTQDSEDLYDLSSQISPSQANILDEIEAKYCMVSTLSREFTLILTRNNHQDPKPVPPQIVQGKLWFFLKSTLKVSDFRP